MKRCIPAVLLLAAIVFTIAGCKSSEQSVPQALPEAVDMSELAPKTETTAPTTEIEPAGRLLDVWVTEEMKPVLELNLKQFRLRFPEFDVDFTVVPPEGLIDRLEQARSKGSGEPDVISVPYMEQEEWGERGLLLDLTDKTASYANRVVPYLQPPAPNEGHSFAAPLASEPIVLYYRRDIFRLAGLPDEPLKLSEALTDFRQFREAAAALKKIGIYLFGEDIEHGKHLLFDAYVQQTGKGYAQIDDSAGRNRLQAITADYDALLRDEYVYPAAPWSEAWMKVAKGARIASIVGTPGQAAMLQKSLPEQSGEWGVIALPLRTADGGGIAHDSESALAIYRNADLPEEAWRFVEFMSFDSSSQAAILRMAGELPALRNAYTHPAVHTPVAYFGNQAVYDEFVKLALAIAPLELSDRDLEAKQTMLSRWRSWNKETEARQLLDGL